MNLMSNNYVPEDKIGTCKTSAPLIYDRIRKLYYLETECTFKNKNITNEICYLNTRVEQIVLTEYTCFLCNDIAEKELINNRTYTNVYYVSLFDCDIAYKIIIFVLTNIFIPLITKLIISINYKTIVNKIILDNLIIEEGILLEDNEHCIICYNEFNIFFEEDNKEKKVIKTNCRIPHYYCYGCIKKWTKHNNNCPYCRTRIVL